MMHKSSSGLLAPRFIRGLLPRSLKRTLLPDYIVATRVPSNIMPAYLLFIISGRKFLPFFFLSARCYPRADGMPTVAASYAIIRN